MSTSFQEHLGKSELLETPSPFVTLDLAHLINSFQKNPARSINHLLDLRANTHPDRVVVGFPLAFSQITDHHDHQLPSNSINPNQNTDKGLYFSKSSLSLTCCSHQSQCCWVKLNCLPWPIFYINSFPLSKVFRRQVRQVLGVRKPSAASRPIPYLDPDNRRLTRSIRSRFPPNAFGVFETWNQRLITGVSGFVYGLHKTKSPREWFWFHFVGLVVDVDMVVIWLRFG